MHIITVGLDHHTSPVEIREQLAFDPSYYPAAYERLLRGAGAPLREAVILSTCNRVEVYGVATDADAAQQAVCDFLHDFHDLPAGLLSPALYRLGNEEAISHLFATTCGLNSLIVGEPQIQGQVRAAAGVAAGLQATGPTLHALFRHALEVGKRARTETGISRSAVSISHAGVELARRLYGDLRVAKVLLVGSGEISELAAKNLIDNGASSITLVNRTMDNARVLAERWGGRALPFEALPEALCEADVVLSSTSAPHAIIHAEQVRNAIAERGGRPILLIDLAVPRDVESEVSLVAGAHVYDIDDLSDVVATNMERRREELGVVEALIAEETERFLNWVSTRAVVPTINRLREQAEGIGRGELERVMRRLPALGQREREAVESLATGIINKLLHEPTVRLKQEAVQGNALGYAEALQYLFGLDRT
jgi:glutamyl-tRNA reductase